MVPLLHRPQNTGKFFSPRFERIAGDRGGQGQGCQRLDSYGPCHFVSWNEADRSHRYDHIINWHTPREGVPNSGEPIDYWDGNPPEFKGFLWSKHMKSIIYGTNTPEEYRFKTISEFKDCIIRGGEVLFGWNGRRCGIFKGTSPYCIALSSGEEEKWCTTADEVLEYMVGNDRLRDVITQVTVWDRTI